MKIVIEGPPNYREIARRFPAAISDGVVFAWGDTIYNPSGAALTPDVVAHEQVHSAQQAGAPARWWGRYLVDDEFRLAQEVPAYRRQFQVVCSQHRNRSVRQRVHRALARELSSPLYGSLIGFDAAVRLIRE